MINIKQKFYSVPDMKVGGASSVPPEHILSELRYPGNLREETLPGRKEV